MALTNPPQRSPHKYLFVDGGCLDVVIHSYHTQFFKELPPPIDLERVATDYRKIYYYDAIHPQNPGEAEAEYETRIKDKRERLAAVERLPRFHVRTGDVRERQGRRKGGNEQKMVDVQLAVDALLMASRGLFDSCTLLTGDLDFRPLIEALVEMGVDVQLLYPPGRTSRDLIAACDHAAPIDAQMYGNWMDQSYGAFIGFPKARHEAPRNDSEWGAPLIEWDEGFEYGKCAVFKAHRDHVLMTERSKTHRQQLVITARTLDWIRLYAAAQFNIAVPA